MSRGGKGLHEPDKQQDALRDRTEHQRAQSGADVRQGVPDAATVRIEDSDLPEGLSRARMGPLDKNTGRGDK
jgi:hypothetical protein